MSYVDLQTVLSEWPYDPEQISARKILGDDGRVKVQVRVELGLMQMEADGRPDGTRPQDCDTLLDYFRDELADHEERNGVTLGFSLTREDCASLYQEALQHYKRYVALYVLEDFRRVIRDTSHNLELLDFCREHALEKKDRTRLEVFRPHALMMEARANAHQALRLGEPVSALAHVNRGLLHIQNHLEEIGRPEAFETSEEVAALLELRDELIDEVPEDSLVTTRKALQAAIEAERFEEAAQLRDHLRAMYHQGDTST